MYYCLYYCSVVNTREATLLARHGKQKECEFCRLFVICYLDRTHGRTLCSKVCWHIRAIQFSLSARTKCSMGGCLLTHCTVHHHVLTQALGWNEPLLSVEGDLFYEVGGRKRGDPATQQVNTLYLVYMLYVSHLLCARRPSGSNTLVFIIFTLSPNTRLIANSSEQYTPTTYRY